MLNQVKHRQSLLRILAAKPATIAAPPAPEALKNTGLRGSVQLRHIDVGSCNGCEVEIANAFGPVYDAGRFGARLVASPRHADGLLVTGVVTRNMDGPLRKTLDATPMPKVVVACGDCAVNGGIFADAYGVAIALENIVEPDICISGCPPHPDAIIEALRRLSDR